jgi:hypothetical protein
MVGGRGRRRDQFGLGTKTLLRNYGFIADGGRGYAARHDAKIVAVGRNPSPGG